MAYVVWNIYAFVWFLNNVNTNGLTCFHCPDISHPRFCNQVQQCGNGQVCSLKSISNRNGEKSFHLGCITAPICDVKPDPTDSGKCYRCCSTDLCNNVGCGEQDHRGLNGSMCYQCDGKLQSEACHQVTFCDYDESCVISEESRFGERFYRNGCQDKSLCQTVQYPYPVVGKRSVQRIKCCNGDLCNSNLNDLPPSSILPTATTFITTAGITDVCMQSRCQNGATCQNQISDKKSLCNCTEGFYGDTCQYAESKGTSFLLLFTEGFIPQYATAKALMTTHKGGLYTAYTFGNNMNESWILQPNQNEFALNHNVYMTDGIKHAGVELQGNKQTSVFGLSYNNYSNDGYSGGYLAIPSHFLSKRYIIPSFEPYKSLSLGKSTIALTPIENSTIVNIHIKTTSGSLTFKNRQYFSGENITAVINKYDTLEISHSSDLTGSFISSSSPLAVVSGNKCNYIKHVFMENGCNMFIEMILPIEQLDKIYVVPHIETRVKSTVRLLSLNASSLTIKNTSNNVLVTKIEARGILDFNHNTISYINATNDVAVTIYPHELLDNGGDAFMMTIHGVNQYLSHYDFVVPKGFTSFISIAVTTNDLNGFIFDGQIITIGSVFTLTDVSGSYSSFSKPISSGEHNMTHIRNTKFGLWVYGNSFNDAYGYPAGIKFKRV